MQTQHVGAFILSRHAQARICQRGLTQKDITLVMVWGEAVDDGYVMTKRALQACQWVAGDEAKRLEQLRGVAVIEIEGVLVTAYRADNRRIRRLRRGPIRPPVARGRVNARLH